MAAKGNGVLDGLFDLEIATVWACVELDGQFCTSSSCIMGACAPCVKADIVVGRRQMASINIFILERGRETRQRLKKLMPAQVREALDQAGRDVDMESGEELRDKLPEGFDRRFVVPEEVLVFPAEEEEPEGTKKRRRRMKDLNNKLRRKRVAGNPS